MNNRIRIIEKPDWVSWIDIKRCLVEAHAVNREKGINMSHYHLTPEQIKESIGNNGLMLVALDDNKVVGTAAIIEQNGKSWYIHGRFAYMGFASVLPEYSGKGIYKELTRLREEIAIKRGFGVLIFDTHCKNKRVQRIAIKNGFRRVSFFKARTGDHFSIIMAKWLNECPFSKIYCEWKFFISMIKAVIKSVIR